MSRTTLVSKPAPEAVQRRSEHLRNSRLDLRQNGTSANVTSGCAEAAHSEALSAKKSTDSSSRSTLCCSEPESHSSSRGLSKQAPPREPGIGSEPRTGATQAAPLDITSLATLRDRSVSAQAMGHLRSDRRFLIASTTPSLATWSLYCWRSAAAEFGGETVE